MGYPTMLPRSARVLEEVSEERVRQDAKWGEQNHPDGTGLQGDAENAERARRICDLAAKRDSVTWSDILTEEQRPSTGGAPPMTDACPVTVYRRSAGRWGEPTLLPVRCGEPMVRWGWCWRHAGEHRRLCGGCGRCS